MASQVVGKMLKAPNSPRAKRKIHKTMGEFKRGTLHSGSKHGPKVTTRAQAQAIALNQARRAEE